MKSEGLLELELGRMCVGEEQYLKSEHLEHQLQDK